MYCSLRPSAPCASAASSRSCCLSVRRVSRFIEDVFVGFETDDLDDAGAALRFLGRGKALRFAALPLRRERDLLDARQQDGVEVVGLLDQDKLAPAAIVAIQVDDGVTSRAGASEKIQSNIVVL